MWRRTSRSRLGHRIRRLHSFSNMVTPGGDKKIFKLTHEAERMSTEIPIWVNGKIRWLSGIDKKTTCKDVVEVLLDGEGLNKSEAKDYTIMERWRKVERQLDENSKILKIWTHWGNEKKEVRLCLRRIDNEVDSGRGSPIVSGYIPSLRRKRNRIRGNEKPPWAYKETLHPRRLAELDRFTETEYEDYPHVKTKQSEAANDRESLKNDEKDIYSKPRDTENLNSKKGHKSYHCSGTGRLHSTPFSNVSENHSRRAKCCSKRESKQKIRNSENIEKLMKLILAQGATIQNQLQKLKEREEQIELLEQERHLERVEKNGRNYLLETYLGSLKDAEIPEGLNDLEYENETVERAKLPEAETTLIKSNKKHGKGNREEDNHTLPSKGLHKSARSKSESRAPEGKLEGNLKRTFSDNALAETSGVAINSGYKTKVTSEIETENTKEEYEDVVELRRIQSQIEMWEKVFRINKKLEKEEENLVRLHIKIKKIQSENYRIAKEKSENDVQENTTETIPTKSDAEVANTDKMQCEQEGAELEKNLETLKSDLEHNSKEIYKNFTRLMEEDEIVAQKRSCLSQIMTDLERTNHEHEMLTEMIAMRENQNTQYNQIDTSSEKSFDFGSKNIESNESNVKIGFQLPPNGVSNLPQVNQRTESCEQENLPPVKPKIVKISFEDKVENYENPERPHEKTLYKVPPPVPAGALKSILKNKKNGFNKKCNLNNELQKFQGVSQNYEQNNENFTVQKSFNTSNTYIQNYYEHSKDVSDRINSSYPYTVAYPLYLNYPEEHAQLYNAQLSKLSENLKSACLSKNQNHPPEIPRTPFPHSTMVTTKALVHNDTDSSTSSDTSGLSSMYSSSTTVEEPFVEKNYVLDTLV